MITVIGYDGAALPAPARAALAGATLVLGGPRHLAAVDVPAGARAVDLGDLQAAVTELVAHDGDAVVVASGDPGFFGIVRRLRAAGLHPTVIPAVSSVALAFARVGLPWDDAVVVSGHGRDPRPALAACRAHRKVAVLTGPGCGPHEIGAAVYSLDRIVVIAERLGEPDERVVAVAPAQAAAGEWREPNVVLVLADRHSVAAEPGWLAGAARTPNRWALPDDEFDHPAGMVTKAEVRALVLARLGPGLGDLVWDVGAGSGSVGIECVRHGAAVVAVERDRDAVARIAANADRHRVTLEVVHATAPAALDRLPDPDAVFVGGGGPDVVAAAAKRGPRVVVAALAAVERVTAVRDALRDAAYADDAVLLSAARLRPLAGATRLAATNPIFVVWGSSR